MGDPLTMVTVGLGALSFVSSMQQTRAQQASYESQAQAADYNAQIADRNAEISGQQTDSDKAELERQQRLERGRNIAAAGASGIVGGSSIDIMADNLTRQTFDVLNLEREGLLRQQNYEIQAGQYRSAAQNYRYQRPSTASGILSAAGSGAQTYIGAGGSF